MHTFKGDEAIFIYNSDLSGDVEITMRPGKLNQARLNVPGSDLLSFVANYLRHKMIDRIEGMSDEEILEVEQP